MTTKGAIFDLDGTLIDSLGDIAESMNQVLASHGMPVHEEEAYKGFVGAGIEHLVNAALPPEEQDGDRLGLMIREMRKEYASRWDVKTRLYVGIPPLLDELVQRGVPLAVASNKPEDFVHLAMKKYLSKWPFAAELGVIDGRPPKPHPASALQAAESMGLLPAECIFVGDSGSDMQTGVAAGMVPVGVLWGFREREELLANGAKHLVSEPMEVVRFFERDQVS